MFSKLRYSVGMAPTCTIHAAALSEFMRTEGLRLTDLADKSGVSIGFLSELCSGTKTRTSPATALKIADALGVRISAISLPEAAA